MRLEGGDQVIGRGAHGGGTPHVCVDDEPEDARRDRVAGDLDQSRCDMATLTGRDGIKRPIADLQAGEPGIR